MDGKLMQDGKLTGHLPRYGWAARAAWEDAQPSELEIHDTILALPTLDEDHIPISERID